MLITLLLGWLFAATPNAAAPGDYWTFYSGQFLGVADTTIEFQIRFYADSAQTMPLSRQYNKWVEIDKNGFFEISDLKFYHEPFGKKHYYGEVRMMGIVQRAKWPVARGCGNLEWTPE
jgi:hypothetical protein